MKKKLLAAGYGVLVVGAIFVMSNMDGGNETEKVQAQQQASGTVRFEEVPDTKKELHPTEADSKKHEALEEAFTEIEKAFENTTSNVDKGYEIYKKAEAVRNAISANYETLMNSKYKDDIEKLMKLRAGIGHKQYVRTASIDSDGDAIEKTQYADQWKPTSDFTKQAYEDMKETIQELT
ncbi:hypothetical protein [Halobacillus ihumii]|uniref:hypothetical protein n=1 Tax=Halobacillus ihumii TaxID=2686092 RepID=UPI0013D68270|nr:hypothetical protein [Halobacillus ihumii]